MVTRMELQQPTEVMIVGSCIPPEPKTLQIASTTFEAEGVQTASSAAEGVEGHCRRNGMSRGSGQLEMRNSAAYWTMPSIFFGPCPSQSG